uniref:Putative transcriptional repressors of the hairy/espl family n=1 Tax=Triatoma infestans TaxID=30076 RepID=A0A023F686_TRIIF
MDTTFWEESQLSAPVKFENHIGYSATPNSEDEEYSFHGKKKMSRDPLSHRIIEKRRRDRMNSCLADLSRLIPHEYMKKGRGRVEKTEIIEMAIRRIKHLMGHAPCKESECHKEEERKNPEPMQSSPETAQPPLLEHLATSYRLGFAECLNETVHFLVQVEGMMASDPFCTQLRSHLTRHCDHILQSESLLSRLCIVKEESTVPLVNESDSLQNNSSNTTLFGENTDDKNGVGPQYHQIQTYQHQQQLVQQQGTNQCCTVQSTNQQNPHHQQQDSSSEASTTTGHLSTISNNHSPTSSNSEKTHPGDTDKAAAPTYKFKNRIQKRFERGVSSSVVPNRAGSANALDESCTNEANRVPVFVLAPRGNYYLPMSLDCGQLPASYQDRAYSDQSDCILLHPVTISVDFRGGIDALDRG